MEVSFRKITPYEAIKEIYSDKENWDFLYEFIEASNEVEEDYQGDIFFIYQNGVSNDKNYYTGGKNWFWIGGYDDNNSLTFIQLINKKSKFHYDLVIAQKKNGQPSPNNGYFQGVVDFIRDNDTQIRWLSTFPLNDKLKKHYMHSGFYNWKKELRLDIQIR